MAFKFALKWPPQSLYLQKIPGGGPPAVAWEALSHPRIHRDAARHVILYHLVKKKFSKKKKLKNTNLRLQPCLDVINPDHKEYLFIFQHIFMAKSGDWKTFLTLFL